MYVYVGVAFVYGVDACMMSVPDQSIYLSKKGRRKGKTIVHECKNSNKALQKNEDLHKKKGIEDMAWRAS